MQILQNRRPLIWCGFAFSLLRGLFAVHVQQCVQFCKPLTLLRQFSFLREWLAQFCLCKFHLRLKIFKLVFGSGQLLRQLSKRIVNPNKIASGIIAEGHLVRKRGG